MPRKPVRFGQSAAKPGSTGVHRFNGSWATAAAAQTSVLPLLTDLAIEESSAAANLFAGANRALRAALQDVRRAEPLLEFDRIPRWPPEIPFKPLTKCPKLGPLGELFAEPGTAVQRSMALSRDNGLVFNVVTASSGARQLLARELLTGTEWSLDLPVQGGIDVSLHEWPFFDRGVWLLLHGFIAGEHHYRLVAIVATQAGLGAAYETNWGFGELLSLLAFVGQFATDADLWAGIDKLNSGLPFPTVRISDVWATPAAAYFAVVWEQGGMPEHRVVRIVGGPLFGEYVWPEPLPDPLPPATGSAVLDKFETIFGRLDVLNVGKVSYPGPMLLALDRAWLAGSGELRFSLCCWVL